MTLTATDRDDVVHRAMTSLNRLAGVVRGLLLFRVVVEIASLGLLGWVAVALAMAEQGRLFALGSSSTIEQVEYALAAAGLVQHLVTGLLFVEWMYRARRNLDLLGAEGLRYSPGAVGWAVFIPFLNFVRPYQVMREIWRATASGHGDEALEAPETYPLCPSCGREVGHQVSSCYWCGAPLEPEASLAPSDSSAAHPPEEDAPSAVPPHDGTSRLVGWWWGLWCLGAFASRIAANWPQFGGDTIQRVAPALVLSAAASLIVGVDALLAALMVQAVTDRQSRRAVDLGLWSPPESVPKGAHPAVPPAPPTDAGPLQSDTGQRPAAMSVVDEIVALGDLHARGLLTDEESSAKKKQLLGL